MVLIVNLAFVFKKKKANVNRMENKNYLESKTILSLICGDTDGVTSYDGIDNLYHAIGYILDAYEPYYSKAIDDLNSFKLEKDESIPQDAAFTDGLWAALAFAQSNMNQLPIKVAYYDPSKLVQWIVSIRATKLIEEMIRQAHTKYGLTYDDLRHHIHKQFKGDSIVNLENKIFQEMLNKK